MELNSVSTNEIVDIFNEYYDKFHRTRIENPLHDVIKSLIGKSLAEEMFGNKNSARISYESYYTKRQLFSELLKSFSKSQQFEILRHLFIKGKYKKTIDSENIKQFIDASTGFESLIKQYESMLESSDCDLEKKRRILNNMLRELDPLRERINKIDSKYDIIFNIGNNFHIRHNNIDGKNKKEALVKMTEDLEADYMRVVSHEEPVSDEGPVAETTPEAWAKQKAALEKQVQQLRSALHTAEKSAEDSKRKLEQQQK